MDAAALPITHDFLATMLGTDRPTVSVAAGNLQKKIIEYTRGAVKIVNRQKLEGSARECYEAIRQYDAQPGLKKKSASETCPVFTCQPRMSRGWRHKWRWIARRDQANS